MSSFEEDIKSNGNCAHYENHYQNIVSKISCVADGRLPFKNP